MAVTEAGNPFCMATVQHTVARPTHPAIIALLFASVGLTMLVALFALVSLAVGDTALGLQLGVVAIVVAAATRYVTERADRA